VRRPRTGAVGKSAPMDGGYLPHGTNTPAVGSQIQEYDTRNQFHHREHRGHRENLSIAVSRSYSGRISAGPITALKLVEKPLGLLAFREILGGGKGLGDVLAGRVVLAEPL